MTPILIPPSLLDIGFQSDCWLLSCFLVLLSLPTTHTHTHTFISYSLVTVLLFLSFSTHSTPCHKFCLPITPDINSPRKKKPIYLLLLWKFNSNYPSSLGSDASVFTVVAVLERTPVTNSLLFSSENNWQVSIKLNSNIYIYI